MLVLGRKEGQAIWIGPEIRVRVCWVGEGQVRLGIDAPPEVAIVREELQPDQAEEKAA